MRPSVFKLLMLVGVALTSILDRATSYGGMPKPRFGCTKWKANLLPQCHPVTALRTSSRCSNAWRRYMFPAMSIAVVHNGKIDWAKGYGVAWVGGPAVTPETLFQAASISKPVTALAILRLVDSGKIVLDHAANDYLKDWKIPETPATATAKVTVTELLNHTSGIHLEGYPGYGSSESIRLWRRCFEAICPPTDPPLPSHPCPEASSGMRVEGTLFLRQLLTDVTGQPFEELMRSAVFLPLKMGQQHLPGTASLRTGCYCCCAARRRRRPFKLGARIYPEESPDGLWTTASDISRYILAMQKSLNGNGYLSKGIAQRMFTPGQEHWGLGPIIGKDPQHPYFMFSGGSAGAKSVFVAYENGDGVRS